MARSSFNKRKNRAKSHRKYRGPLVARKLDSPESEQASGGNQSSAASPVAEFKAAGPAPEPGHTPPAVEPDKPDQAPLIKASDLFTFSKRRLTSEARELLARIDEGGIPIMVSHNLERIAKENGIEVSNRMTPDDIIRRLRKLA